MTKSQLEAVIDALAQLAESYNEPADEEHGWGNDPICLSIWGDGSGTIGRRRSPHEFEDIHEFDTFGELVKVLQNEGVEFTEEDEMHANPQ